MRVVRIVGTRRRHSSLRELIDILMGACFGRFMGETQAEEWERKQRKLEKKRAKDEQCKRDNEILKAVFKRRFGTSSVAFRCFKTSSSDGRGEKLRLAQKMRRCVTMRQRNV